MIGIIAGLFAGWFLGLFGFKAVVIAGMLQVFGVTINTLGYYFLFSLLFSVKGIALNFSNPFRFSNYQNKKKETKENNKK